jgi:hypothetical protein
VAYREVRVNEVREVLRHWLAGDGLRTAGERAGVDRKTARRYVAAGEAAGLRRDGGDGQLCDELIGAVVAAVRPARASGHGAAWEALLPVEAQITDWVKAGLVLTNIHGKLTRRGVLVPYLVCPAFSGRLNLCYFMLRLARLSIRCGPGAGSGSLTLSGAVADYRRFQYSEQYLVSLCSGSDKRFGGPAHF